MTHQVEFVSNVYEEDGRKVIQCNIRDITQRKFAETNIAEQAAFLDKARDAIVAGDLAGKILFWNKGAERLYGWASGEVCGKNVGQLLYADPQRFQEINELVLSRGEWTGEIEHLTKSRGEIVIEMHWTLIKDREGNPKSVLAINTDITEKKRIEAQFMRAQRMESIGTLAGGIAHDLNNILTPIMMSIDVLKTAPEMPPSDKLLETMEVSAKRGADIVRQVLSFARGLEGARIEIEPKHLLRDLESIIKNTFPKNVRLKFVVSNDTWRILGDPTQIHQILLNLCVNARDAMPNGGDLTIEIENRMMDEQYAEHEQYAADYIKAKAGPYVKIGVSDTGMGIPPELMNKIFEPFFTTKELHKGTGLGLSTVMAVVKSHDGIVNVYSEPGLGTTFSVYIPATVSSAGAQQGVGEEAEVPRGMGETILVVDDEAAILTITSETLLAFGYKVLTAINGMDAVRLYEARRDEIAVVLTDMMMPVMDGLATIAALTRINPAVKIIAASSFTASSMGTKLEGEGVKHFLTKPYTARTLVKVVRMVIEESRVAPV
jgi:PAS domain S-box-containing protein